MAYIAFAIRNVLPVVAFLAIAGLVAWMTWPTIKRAIDSRRRYYDDIDKLDAAEFLARKYDRQSKRKR